jgi:hypothetical protein
MTQGVVVGLLRRRQTSIQTPSIVLYKLSAGSLGKTTWLLKVAR